MSDVMPPIQAEAEIEQAPQVSEPVQKPETTQEAPQESRDELKARLRQEKETDVELSNLMDGKVKRTSESGEVAFEPDEAIKNMTMEERRQLVIDKKTNSLIDFASQREGADISGQNAAEVMGSVFDSEEEREEYQKSVYERILGGIEYSQEVINENLDADTLFQLIVGQEVGEGRYSSGRKGTEQEADQINFSESYKFLKHKKRHLDAAFQMCGFPEATQNWGDGEEPADITGVVNVIDNNIYPDSKKSLIFMKTFLVSMGKTDIATKLNDPENAQKMVLQLRDAIMLK